MSSAPLRSIVGLCGTARCVVAVVLCSIVVLSGCTNGPGAAGAGSAIERLERLAQIAPSDQPRADTPAPPDSALDVLPSDRADAFATLSEVIATWPVLIEASETEPGETDARQALRFYAEARQFSADGEASRAIKLLEQAADLDPGSPQVWRALGDARRDEGFESSSGAAYLRASELGLSEPEGLLFAGLHTIRRDEPERAAGLLMRAVSTPIPHADPLVHDVATVHLGEVLLDLGRIRAGVEMLELGMDIPRSARVPTNVGAEASAIHRRRGGLLSRLGDGWCQLGEFGRAAGAYGRAALTSAGSTPEIRARRIFALRRAGRPAEAALLLLDDLRSGMILDSRSLDALSSVAARVSPRDLLADAIAELDDSSSATRRVGLLLARASALPSRSADRLLEDALKDRSIASTSAARRSLLKARLMKLRVERPARLIKTIDKLVALNRSLAPAAASSLFLLDPEPGTLWDRISEGIDDQPRREALLGELALLLDDPALIAEMLDAGDGLGGDPDQLARRSSLAAALGRWDVVDSTIDRLAALPAGDVLDRDAALLRANEAAQRFDDAHDIARRIAGTDTATTDDLLRFSALAHLLGDTDTARDALERALAADPADERVYKAIITFHSPKGPFPDNERSSEIGRSLRENAPSGLLLRRIVATEMLRRGLLDEGGDRLDSLFAEDPTAPDTLDATLMRWSRLVSADRVDEINLEPVREAVNEHPASGGLVRLLTGGLVMLGKPEEALAEAEAFGVRTGSRTLAGLSEQLIRDAFGDAPGADERAEARIGDHPHSIIDSIELASIRARLLDGTEASDPHIRGVHSALAEIPVRSGLTELQQNSVSGSIARISAHLNKRREDADPESPGPASMNGPALACLAWSADRTIPFAPATHNLRLTLLVESRADLGVLVGAAEQAIVEYPQTTRAFARRVVELLTASSREPDAFAWASGASFDDTGSIRPEIFAEWFRLVLITADERRGAELIESLVSHDALLDAWSDLRPEGGLWDERDGSLPAEMAYLMAQYSGTSADPDATETFLRLTLDLDPEHPWACNDLGYSMLEEGGSLIEAERLIEIAFMGLPDRANVVDSLGWVRYHRDRLEDETDPESGEVVLGAITLLRRASEQLGTDDDGTVNDHLGDALYAAGRVDDAIDAWRQTVSRANNTLSRLKASGQTGGVRFREAQRLATDAAMKRNAIQMGVEPGIEQRRGVSTLEDRPGGTPPEPGGP